MALRLIACLVAVVGCGSSEPARVVVIDLEAVARSMGRDDLILQQLANANQQLAEQVNQIASQLQSALVEEKGRLESEEGEQGQSRLQELIRQANLELDQIKLLAQQRSLQVREALLQQFYAEIRPAVAEVARRHGARAAVTTGSSLVWFEPSIDITGEVIAKLRAEPPVKPAPAAPPPEPGGATEPGDAPAPPAEEGGGEEPPG